MRGGRARGVGVPLLKGARALADCPCTDFVFVQPPSPPCDAQGTPEPCIEWRGDASAFSTILAPLTARFRFGKAMSKAALQEYSLVHQLLSQDWGRLDRGQADIEPQCRPWSLSQHAEVLEAVKGAAARHEPVVELAVLPLAVFNLRGPIDPTPEQELLGDQLPCFYCRGFHKRKSRLEIRDYARMVTKYERIPLVLSTTACPLITTYLGTWVIRKGLPGSDLALAPPIASNREGADRPARGRLLRAHLTAPCPFPWRRPRGGAALQNSRGGRSQGARVPRPHNPHPMAAGDEASNKGPHAQLQGERGRVGAGREVDTLHE